MSFKKNKIFFCLVILGMFFLLQKAEALTISPSLVKLEMSPGEEKIQKIRLSNETNQSLIYYASVENFSSDKNTNIPVFLGDNDPFAAARWFRVAPLVVELKSGEKKDISVTVKAPLSAEPGGHYAAVLFSDISPQGEGVRTANRLASLFLLTVKGEYKESLEVVSFAKKERGRGFVLTVENKGTVHLQPSGKVEIFNSKNQIVGQLALNELKQNILPQSIRTFDIVNQEKFHWGKYIARAQIFFGKDKVIEKEIVFWQWPKNIWQKILGTAAVILLLAIILKTAKQKARNV